MSEPRREFYDVRKAFPLNPVEKEYLAHLEMGYYDAGDLTGEWSVVWVDLGRYGPAAQVRMFDDGWKAYVESGAAELLSGLDPPGSNKSLSIDELRAKLSEAGWTDLTDEYAAKWEKSQPWRAKQ